MNIDLLLAEPVPFTGSPWDEVILNLWQGCHRYDGPDGKFEKAIVGDEFSLVISLYSFPGHGPAEGVEHHRILLADGVLKDVDLGMVRRLADVAEQAVRDSRRTLVRCQAGLNRSGLVTAFALMRLGYPAADAIDLIREKRSPNALCNAHFVRYIFAESVRLERETAAAVTA